MILVLNMGNRLLGHIEFFRHDRLHIEVVRRAQSDVTSSLPAK